MLRKLLLKWFQNIFTQLLPRRNVINIQTYLTTKGVHIFKKLQIANLQNKYSNSVTLFFKQNLMLLNIDESIKQKILN